MKILAINGSHRAGKGTAFLVETALEEARALGCETELVELSRCKIEYCIGCNRCLGKPECTVQDDMQMLYEKMAEADGIILASPNYYANVTARMKCFMDRTRPLHMTANALKGKVGGLIATTGLNNCGGEETVASLQRWFQIQEILLVQPRPEGEVRANYPMGSMFRGMEDGRVKWRRIEDDEVAIMYARQLGKDMVELIGKLS